MKSQVIGIGNKSLQKDRSLPHPRDEVQDIQEGEAKFYTFRRGKENKEHFIRRILEFPLKSCRGTLCFSINLKYGLKVSSNICLNIF